MGEAPMLSDCGQPARVEIFALRMSRVVRDANRVPKYASLDILGSKLVSESSLARRLQKYRPVIDCLDRAVSRRIPESQDFSRTSMKRAEWDHNQEMGVEIYLALT